MKIEKKVYISGYMGTYSTKPVLTVELEDYGNADRSNHWFGLGEAMVTFDIPDNHADQVNAYFAEQLEGQKAAFQAECGVKLQEYDDAIQSLKALPAPGEA